MKIPAHEELLLARCYKRESAAIKALTDLYGPRIYGFICSLLGPDADQANNILISAFSETIQETQPFEMVEPFLVSLMRNVNGKIEKKFSQKSIPTNWPKLDLRKNIIFGALGSLSWHDKVLILLRDQLDFDFDEIAEITGRSSKSLKPELQKARIQFRSAIEKQLSGKQG